MLHQQLQHGRSFAAQGPSGGDFSHQHHLILPSKGSWKVTMCNTRTVAPAGSSKPLTQAVRVSTVPTPKTWGIEASVRGSARSCWCFTGQF